MTEMVNGDNQSSSNFAGVPVTPSSTQTTSAPTESERTFRQSEVNDLVGRAKNEAIERYKRESSMASHNTPQNQQAYAPQPNQQQYTPPAPHQVPNISQDEVRRLAAEETQRLRNEWAQESNIKAQEQDAQRIASEFYTKVGAGEGGMQAFEKVIQDSGVDLRSIPYHVQLANMVENTREVMIELANNPSKIGMIQNLIDIDLKAGRQPNLAMAEMRRLSQSMKDNAHAKNFKAPNDPLSQMRPSTAGTDTGARSVSDYKRNPAYRI
jgi:hypothetical protein